ncbi:MAG: DUF6048 family protein [Flavobacteriaceae bacterium]|nr:DUF6048 family protein [Flavobacteriaceae bacterium]
MKQQSISLYFISIFFISIPLFSQEVKKDTVIIKDIYGLRIGVDISNPIKTLFNSDRKAYEIVADYRLNKKLYAAAEIGYLDNLRAEDNFEFTTKGQYIRLGVNYNTYKNWLNMDNEIYIGTRYGFSTFSQTLENYTITSDITLPEIANTNAQKFTGLNANWVEFIIGIKVEVYANIFLGFSLSTRKMISTKEPKNFKNLYVPGFDRVFLNDSSFGFNYTISYRLPLYKKESKKIPTKKED